MSGQQGGHGQASSSMHYHSVAGDASRLQNESQMEQHSNSISQAQPMQPSLDQTTVAAEDGPASSSSPHSGGRTGSNSLHLGLGFLRGLGLDKRTNRDGQPSKRRGPKPDSRPALTRRQELNRQAQRTHRQRKEVYIKSLEDQITQLRELYTQQTREMSAVDEENHRLRDLLLLHGIPIPADLQQHSIAPQISPKENAALVGVSSGESCVGHEGGSYQSPSSYQHSVSEHKESGEAGSALSLSSTGALQQHQQAQAQPTKLIRHPSESYIQGNTDEQQLGIDFVLGLEAFCHDHTQYLSVRSMQSSGDAEPMPSGHAHLLSYPPLSHLRENPSEFYPHQAPPLPPATLSTLLESSRQLPWVGNGELTPVMALNMVCMDPRYPQMLVRQFLAIRKRLEEKVRCYGFGAVVEEFEVRDAIDNALSGST